MAGDWIKFQNCTVDKPEIWDIASELNIDPDAVIGKLLRVWIWFDEHTEKGNAPIVTKMLLDRNVGVTGFCDAVIKASWMLEKNNKISLPNFDRHNGKTAKNRAMTAIRVSNHKKKGNGKGNGAGVTSALPREEKRREEIKENKKKKFIPPKLEEVIAFFNDNGYTRHHAEKVFKYYEEGDWKDASGKPVKVWKQKMRGNWFKDENKIPANELGAAI